MASPEAFNHTIMSTATRGYRLEFTTDSVYDSNMLCMMEEIYRDLLVVLSLTKYSDRDNISLQS